jgi:hypothetical protein
VKLAVVHFTIYHLLSIRDEPIPTWKLIFYILTPLIIVAQHALVLLAIIGVAAYWVFRPIARKGYMLYRALQWLFGKVPSTEEGSYEMLPTSTTRRGQQTVQNGNKKSVVQSIATRIGRILVAAAFLTQCIGTIFIYHRRQIHGAFTLADKRVLKLGCSGLVTASLTLGILFTIPLFSQPVSDITKSDEKF